MGKPSLYLEATLAEQCNLQKTHAWDLESAIDWNRSVDLSKPFVPLDESALFFPGASAEQRLAISQMMGLVIAASVCEMEECLLRLKKSCFHDVCDRHPVSPEFENLGELFFEEEEKHSKAFRRFLKIFSEEVHLDPWSLREVLPMIEQTKTEWLLRKNLDQGGHTFWWVVANVEQEFLRLYTTLQPFQKALDPLYFDLHRRHYEEEARHSSFPYFMIEIYQSRTFGLRQILHQKIDFMLAQGIQVAWTLAALQSMKKIKRLRFVHPFFEVLGRAFVHFESQSGLKTLWQVMTSTPYVSSLVNPSSHRKVIQFLNETGTPKLPFPSYVPRKLVA